MIDAATATEITDLILTDDPDLRERIGVHLGTVRRTRKINQEEVAKLNELSRPHLSNIEVGRSRATWVVLKRLAEYYDLDMRDLIAELGGTRTPGVAVDPRPMNMRFGAPTFDRSHLSDYECFVLSGFHHLLPGDRHRLIAEILLLIQQRLGQ